MTATQLFFAGLLDVVLGDPRWFPHPVRLMGKSVAWFDRSIRRIVKTPLAQKAAGISLALGLPAIAYVGAWCVIDWTVRLGDLWRSIAVVVVAWTTLAARDLVDHVLPVLRALENGDLDQARKAVSSIVGRDTEHLTDQAVVRATVETLAESTSDGIVAPLLYLAFGGPPLALAYKAVSTLDSMIGHLDDRHRHLGWASARLDDLVNWLPARITAVLLVLAAGLCGFRPRQAWMTWWRDGHKHPSPNSGRPEAAMAGALGVELGGVSTYDGIPIERPKLGSPDIPLTPQRIREALRLVVVTSLAAFMLAAALTWR